MVCSSILCTVLLKILPLVVVLVVLSSSPSLSSSGAAAQQSSGQMLLAGLSSTDEGVVRAAVASASKKELNKRGQGGQTPLMASVLGGNDLAVKCLLESKDVDVNIGENDGYTPMHGAGFQGRAKIAKMLIAHGISMSDVHSDGFTPLHRACWGREKRHTSTVKTFLKAGVDPDEKSKDGKVCAEMTQNKDTLKLLSEWKSKRGAGGKGRADGTDSGEL